MGPILRYNLSRFALFAAFLGIGYLVGLAGFVLLAAALLGSGVTAYFVLKPQRLAMIAAMQVKVEQRQAKAAARAAREDAWDDERRAHEASGPDGLS